MIIGNSMYLFFFYVFWVTVFSYNFSFDVHVLYMLLGDAFCGR